MNNFSSSKSYVDHNNHFSTEFPLKLLDEWQSNLYEFLILESTKHTHVCQLVPDGPILSFFTALSDDQCIVYNYCCFWVQYDDLATQEEQYSPSRMWINNNNYYFHNMISDELTQTYQRKCYQAKIVVWSQYRTKIEKEDISLGDIF